MWDEKMASRLDKVIYKSGVMQQVRKEVEPCVKTASPILFWGESGSGMGFYAGAIHEVSRDGKLLREPCFNLDENTIQEQLFGVNDQKGWLEKFDKGTIFFKRIEETSLAIQKTLLHLIEIQSVNGRIEFCRKGTTTPVFVNVRFIFSMAEDYEIAIQEELLLRDLGDIVKKRGKIVHLPPMRQRKEDIIDIANNFVDEFNQEYNRKVASIDPKTQKLLTKYLWPGNVDELKRVFNGIFVEYPEIATITADHLPEYIIKPKITGDKFSFKLKDEEKFTGKILSKSLRIQKNDGTTFRINTAQISEIIRIEDATFAPPRYKHFVLKLKDGSRIIGKILDKKMTLETSFNANYQINPHNLYEVMVS